MITSPTCRADFGSRTTLLLVLGLLFLSGTATSRPSTRDQRLQTADETESGSFLTHKGINPILPGECVSGELSLTDIALSNGSLVDVYMFQWTGGDLSISFDSPDFDEYLIVFEPPGAPGGKETVVNESTSNTEVFVLEDAPQGEYTLWATSNLAERLGAYELCVSQSDVIPSMTPSPTLLSTPTSTSIPVPTSTPEPTDTSTPIPTSTPTATISVGCDAPQVPSDPFPDSGSIDIATDMTLGWNGTSIAKSTTAGNSDSIPKVIYGEDDRLDVYEVDDPDLLAIAESTVVIVGLSELTDNGDETYTLDSTTFNEWAELLGVGTLCLEEPFRDQPAPGVCSGFLAGPDLVVTAGDCVGRDCGGTAFVFGFHMLDDSTARITVDADDVYFCAEAIGDVAIPNGPDYSIVRLDREVEGRRPLPIRREGKVEDGQELVVVGYPFGLPTKISGGANVRDNSDPDFFVANLDTYVGSAGSPVLNSETLIVEGIMVRGEVDFDDSGSCVRSNVCPDEGCLGEDSTRTTVFADLVPDSIVYDVYFGPCGSMEILGTTDETRWPLSGLDPNTHYCWKIVAKNPCGESESPVWGFKTDGDPIDCDSGYYLLDSFGARHRVGDPSTINGQLYFGNDIARDMERAQCSAKGGARNEDLVVLDGLGAVHFVANEACNVAQGFYFDEEAAAFPQGRAVDVEMTKDSAGFWVLTDFGGIYRAGTAKDPGDPDLLPGSEQTGLLGFDVPVTGDLRRPGFPDPGGASLRAVSLVVIDTDADSRADGYVVLDSMGGRYHSDADGNSIPAGFSATAGANDPRLLLDPDAYAWPFFPGMDIARDMELHPTGQGVVILDGWDGLHPVPVNVGSNPVFFAQNAVSENNHSYRSNNGMPYMTSGFDIPTTTPENESDSTQFGADAFSVFVDIEFSAGCRDGLYTLDRFGGVYTLGATRKVEDEPGSGFGNSPYFFPNLYARDLEIFSLAERETSATR